MPFQLDTLLLKSFVAVAESGNFSNAARIVGRTQSAVSLQIKKLEDSLGCPLFDRTGGKVKLTNQGEIFLGYARRIIELHWEAYSRLHEPEVEGAISLGTPEDFATHYLPGILAEFNKHHPHVRLSVKCDLTLNLFTDFHDGKLDIILVKRDPGRVKGGIKVWREPLVWAGAEKYQIKTPLQLVLSPQPCIYRGRALAALDRARIGWDIVYTSPSLAGTIAAVQAGLGITVLPAAMVPQGLSEIRGRVKLPHLVDSEIALMKKDGLSVAGKILAEHIITSLS